jgi:hypothetical protein
MRREEPLSAGISDLNPEKMWERSRLAGVELLKLVVGLAAAGVAFFATLLPKEAQAFRIDGSTLGLVAWCYRSHLA